MATPSSPAPSTSSSRSSTFSPSKFSNLPIAALREKIVEKVLENRVTLIVGETGCGKSSQVPQFLLEANVKPILCTQPRRFAVVAVAKMVAEVRNTEIGGEVGYHIGHSKHLSPSSVIVFKTAGVLLDEMRDKGMKALDYKVIILDEVHERSVESDLVLVCVKQFMMKNNNLRVVLMSATADIQRYRDYFKDLGRDERVEVLAIPTQDQKTIFQKSVSYLEEVSKLLDINSEESLSQTYCSGPNPSAAKADFKENVHRIIHQLVLHIHDNEPDIEKGILIFLPTYYALEQQWYLLQPLSSSFKVHILHSSIDTEKALMAMKIWKSHRKVILATNIAESSVTIPKVAYVIDSCRSLQVFWNNCDKKESAKLVWVSKSQAEQRRGRTGRTCDGKIYRLVTRHFFSQFDEYEGPSILRLSLRLQALHICCADSKAINDPKALLQKALDPPPSDVVEDALNLLVQMQALEKTSRGRYEPTFYGRLLASFALSFDASVLVLKFGDAGMLREGILLGILMDTQPLPIHRPFGDEILCSEYADSYFCGDDNTCLKGRKEISLMGNLCALQFWQRVFKDIHRVESLKQLLKFDEMKATTFQFPAMEDWCSFHNLVQSSLNHVSEIYEDILDSVHRFRPTFLSMSNGLPSYIDPYEYKHVCNLAYEQQSGDTDALATDHSHLEISGGAIKCVAVPFVDSDDFRKNEVAKNLATIMKQIIVLHADDASSSQDLNGDNGFHVNVEAPVCIYFIKGICKKGSQCTFSHSLKARKTPCQYFYSLQGCRYGQSCLYTHDESPFLASSSSSTSSTSNFCLPEDGLATATSLLKLFPISSDGYLLLLDDTNLHFTSNLASFYDPSKIISTTSLSDTSIFDPSLKGVKVLWGLHHPYQTIISNAGESQIPWNEVKCVLWFPNLASYSENLDIQRTVLQNFFAYLAIRMLGNAMYDVLVILTMNNIRFSQLQVEKLSRESFFFLRESFPFDELSFGELPDKVSTKKPMMVSRATSYVFGLNPPSKIQFGDYASVLHKSLCDVQKNM